jgi:predicted nucleic acid-binding protein
LSRAIADTSVFVAMEAGRRIRRHDAWIAASALRHGVGVVTQDADFSAFATVEVVRV